MSIRALPYQGAEKPACLIARDGKEIPIDESAAPIRGANGLVQGTVLVFRDLYRLREGGSEFPVGRRNF